MHVCFVYRPPNQTDRYTLDNNFGVRQRNKYNCGCNCYQFDLCVNVKTFDVMVVDFIVFNQGDDIDIQIWRFFDVRIWCQISEQLQQQPQTFSVYFVKSTWWIARGVRIITKITNRYPSTYTVINLVAAKKATPLVVLHCFVCVTLHAHTVDNGETISFVVIFKTLQ